LNSESNHKKIPSHPALLIISLEIFQTKSMHILRSNTATV